MKFLVILVVLGLAQAQLDIWNDLMNVEENLVKELEEKIHHEVEEVKGALSHLIHSKRNFFDAIKQHFIDLGHKISLAAQTVGTKVSAFAHAALPVVEKVGSQYVLPTLSKLAPTLVSAAITALGKRDVAERGIFDHLLQNLHHVGQNIEHVLDNASESGEFQKIEEELHDKLKDAWSEAVASLMLESMNKEKRGLFDKIKNTLGHIDLVGTVEKAALGKLAGVLIGALGKREIETRSFFSKIKNALVGTLEKAALGKLAGVLIGAVGKREIESRSFFSKIKNALVGTLEKAALGKLAGVLIGAVGKREIEERSFLSKLKHALVGTLEKAALGKLTGVLIGAVGKRDMHIPGILGHISEEIKSVFGKVEEGIKGAANIAGHLKDNMINAVEGLSKGHNIKDLANKVLSTLEKDVHNMIEGGTFDMNLEKMFGDIVPNAFSKLISKHSRRNLFTDAAHLLVSGTKDVLGLVSGTALSNLHNYINQIKETATAALAPSIQNVKDLATTFLTEAGKTTAHVAQQAVKFFQPFQAQLGSVFDKIKSLASKLTTA